MTITLPELCERSCAPHVPEKLPPNDPGELRRNRGWLVGMPGRDPGQAGSQVGDRPRSWLARWDPGQEGAFLGHVWEHSSPRGFGAPRATPGVSRRAQFSAHCLVTLPHAFSLSRPPCVWVRAPAVGRTGGRGRPSPRAGELGFIIRAPRGTHPLWELLGGVQDPRNAWKTNSGVVQAFRKGRRTVATGAVIWPTFDRIWPASAKLWPEFGRIWPMLASKFSPTRHKSANIWPTLERPKSCAIVVERLPHEPRSFQTLAQFG